MKRTGRFVSLTQHSSEKTHTRPGDKIQQIPGRTAHTAGLTALCEVTRALTGGVKKFDTLLIFTLCSWCKCGLLCRRHCCLNAEIYLWATPSSSEGLCFIQPDQQTSTAQFVLHHHLPLINIFWNIMYIRWKFGVFININININIFTLLYFKHCFFFTLMVQSVGLANYKADGYCMIISKGLCYNPYSLLMNNAETHQPALNSFTSSTQFHLWKISESKHKSKFVLFCLNCCYVIDYT